MVTRSKPRNSAWASLCGGLALGAAGVALLAVAVIGLSLLLDVPLLLLMSFGFEDMRLLFVGASGLLATLLAGGALIWLLRRMVAGRLFQGGWVGSVAAASGAALASLIGVWVMPEPIKDTALQFATGQTTAQRAANPAAHAARQRLKEVVAAQPGGPEAELLRAVDLTVEPRSSPGRVSTADDAAARVDALQRLARSLSAEWQPLLLGTIGHVQRRHSGNHPDDAPMRAALAEAGRAGSHLFRVLAAQEEEGIAHADEVSRRLGPADLAWQRALDGYAAAGAAFEVARLHDETLPERLRALPAVAAASAPVPDAAFAQRLWKFAQALGDDAAYPHATPGQRELAAAVSLIALERAPEVAAIAVQNPAQRWAVDPWAIGRSLLTLRHARGECMAALALSDAIRQRRRPAVSNAPAPPASSLDMAWALAWIEAAEGCARTDAQRQLLRERRANLDYLIFAPGELEAARAGVAASVAAWR